MGAVQSGKTASLVAVTAKALDRGVNVVVVLAGTRLALWRQTYDRIVSQLDCWEHSIDQERRRHRVFLPSPSVISAGLALPDLSDLYFETPNRIRKMLSTGHPLVAVVMKHTDHLSRFGKQLTEVLESVFERSIELLHMLVIDDEADDGSILDSVVESGMALDSDGLKQIPRHIARLWSGQGPHHRTFHPRLFATYLAYTATPQANFSQADHNPLSPSDFLAALRVPLDSGSIRPPRSSTYTEPLGVRSYYSGGELFYRRLAHSEGALCVSQRTPVRGDFNTDEEFLDAFAGTRAELLSNSLRSYFISGAIRLHLSRKSLNQARNVAPSDFDAIRLITPDAHTMLFHPSARVDTHFLAAKEIFDWTSEFGDGRQADISALARNGFITLNVDGLIARLEDEEEKWKEWVFSYEKTRDELTYLPLGRIYPKVDVSIWEDIRRTLVEEVFPNARVVVINSDPRADDRPRFDPESNGDGNFIAARDIFTIFISGNVMSRGITLDGLCTTLFLRNANDPVADSQMQMQRWFGYRGKYLNLCRVFMFDDQLNLFCAYHENDEALRRSILNEMNLNPGSPPSPLVLQGVNFKATSKIANLRALPLCPGADPFVRVVDHSLKHMGNSLVLSELLNTKDWNEVVVGGIGRGKAMVEQLDLIQVAEILESMKYEHHDPSPTSDNNVRWKALASELNIDELEAPLFRPPGVRADAPEAVAPKACPYSIAAYLRLWKALLTRKARGIIPTDDRSTWWSMIDLASYARTVPKFYVGIRYGSEGLSNVPELAVHNVLCVKRSSDHGILESTWGSRNPGVGEDAYLGDQLFDYHIHGGIPPVQIPGEPTWRLRGSPGLLLFHVLRGEAGEVDGITVGLSIPLGGPDHIAALRPGTRH